MICPAMDLLAEQAAARIASLSEEMSALAKPSFTSFLNARQAGDFSLHSKGQEPTNKHIGA